MLISTETDMITTPMTAMSGTMLLPSTSLRTCNTETELAALLSRGIADAVTNDQAEAHSLVFFQRLGVIPAIQFFVTSFFLPRLWLLTIPYLSIYFYWDTTQMSCGPKLERAIDERDYISLVLMHRAGYYINSSLEFWSRNLHATRNNLAMARSLGLSGKVSIRTSLNEYMEI